VPVCKGGVALVYFPGFVVGINCTNSCNVFISYFLVAGGRLYVHLLTPPVSPTRVKWKEGQYIMNLMGCGGRGSRPNLRCCPGFCLEHCFPTRDPRVTVDEINSKI